MVVLNVQLKMTVCSIAKDKMQHWFNRMWVP